MHHTALHTANCVQVPGGTMRDSYLVKGVAFKKTFSYAGFEQQPKSFEDPKILLLNIELELKSEKENAEVRWVCGVRRVLLNLNFWIRCQLFLHFKFINMC